MVHRRDHFQLDDFLEGGGDVDKDKDDELVVVMKTGQTQEGKVSGNESVVLNKIQCMREVVPLMKGGATQLVVV